MAEKMRRRARLIRRVAELALVLLRPFEEIGKIVCRYAWGGDEHQRRLDAADHRMKLIDRPACVRKHVWQDFRKRLCPKPQQRAISRRVRDVLRGEASARTGL